MDEFLKRELEKIEIPEQVYLEARDQAWARLREKSRPPRAKIAWAAAAAALIVAVLLGLLTRNTPKTDVQVQTPPPISPPVAVEPAPEPKPAPIPQSAQRPVRKRRAPAAAPRPADRPDRLVLNFVLPDSGIRMIWIMDKNFKLEGGSE